jgi:hypothetical protein
MDLSDILRIVEMTDEQLAALVEKALAEMNLRYWLRIHPEWVTR